MDGFEAPTTSDVSTPESERDSHLPDPEDLVALCSELNNCTFASEADEHSGDSENGPQPMDKNQPKIAADISETLKKGVDELSAGLKSDQEGQFRDAFKHYKNGLAQLLFCRKYAKKNEAFLASLTKKCEEYMRRAEQIRDKLKSSEAGEVMEDETPTVWKLPEFVRMDTPALKLPDVIGLEKVKDCLKECVILPMKFPQLFQAGRRPHPGILLYGPPGVGKTMLASALAGELAGLTVLRASIYDFTSKYMSDGDRQMRELFFYANEHAPSLLIFDDLEGLFQPDSETHRRLMAEWICQFSGLSGLTLVLALTLSPWEIHAAVRKKFSRRIYVPLPDSTARAEMFQSFLSPPHLTTETCPELTPDDWEELAHKTQGLTGADISVVTRDSMMAPIRELQKAKYFRKVVSKGAAGEAVGKFIPCCHDYEGALEINVLDLPEKEVFLRRITKDDILKATDVKPSVGKEDLAKFSKFTEDFGHLL